MVCQNCEPPCGCGLLAELSAPQVFSGYGDALEVYNAVVSLCSLDRTILEYSAEAVSERLVQEGFFSEEPSPADVEGALDLVAQAEQP
jgi:hypothetical protein